MHKDVMYSSFDSYYSQMRFLIVNQVEKFNGKKMEKYFERYSEDVFYLNLFFEMENYIRLANCIKDQPFLELYAYLLSSFYFSSYNFNYIALGKLLFFNDEERMKVINELFDIECKVLKRHLFFL